MSSARTRQHDHRPARLPAAEQRESAVADVAAAQARTGPVADIVGRYAPAVLSVALPAAAMTALGLWGLTRQSSMANDEVATRWAALLSLPHLAHLLLTIDAVHGMYYLLIHCWMAVGTSPAVMRLPSVVAMVTAVALTAIIGRRLTGSPLAGLFAGLIMACTPCISYYAQTARSYALVLACVLGSTLALLRALDADASPGGDRGARFARPWLAYSLLVALGGYLNEMALLVLAAHGITVALTGRGRPVLIRWAKAAAIGAALVLPLLLLSAREASSVSFIPRPGLSDLRTLAGDYFAPVPVVGICLAICAVIAILPPLTGLRRRPAGAASGAPVPADQAWRRARGISLPSVAAPLLLAPASILLLESVLLRPLYLDRYVLYGEAGVALLVGAGLHRIGRWLGAATGRPAAIWAPGAIACACVLVAQFPHQEGARSPGSRRYDFGGPARYVGARAQHGDGVLFFDNFFRKDRLGYPADFARTRDLAQAESPTQAGTFRGTDKSFQATGPLMLTYRRIWVVGLAPSPQLPPGLLRDESLVLARRFTLVAQRQFKGIVVTLWLRR